MNALEATFKSTCDKQASYDDIEIGGFSELAISDSRLDTDDYVKNCDKNGEESYCGRLKHHNSNTICIESTSTEVTKQDKGGHAIKQAGVKNSCEESLFLGQENEGIAASTARIKSGNSSKMNTYTVSFLTFSKSAKDMLAEIKSYRVDYIKQVIKDTKLNPIMDKKSTIKVMHQFDNKDFSALFPVNAYDQVYHGIYLGDKQVTHILVSENARVFVSFNKFGEQIEILLAIFCHP